MPQASFNVPWDDFDYESWVAKCGAQLLAVEPNPNGTFDLIVSGETAAIELFAATLG